MGLHRVRTGLHHRIATMASLHHDSFRRTGLKEEAKVLSLRLILKFPSSALVSSHLGPSASGTLAKPDAIPRVAFVIFRFGRLRLDCFLCPSPRFEHDTSRTGPKSQDADLANAGLPSNRAESEADNSVFSPFFLLASPSNPSGQQNPIALEQQVSRFRGTGGGGKEDPRANGFQHVGT